MTSESGAAARNRRLFDAVRHSRDDGGEYWTSDKEKRAGRSDVGFRVDGTKPVSSCTNQHS
jgi:hypothetical protein